MSEKAVPCETNNMGFGFRKRADATEAVAPVESNVEEPEIAHATGSDTDFNVQEGVDQLKKFQKTHQWDYNLDYDQIDTVNKAVNSDDLEKTANIEHALLEEDSPYFEVRASVRNYDEYVPKNFSAGVFQ